MTPFLRRGGSFAGLLLILVVPGCIGIVGIGEQERKTDFSRPFDSKSYELKVGKPDHVEVARDGSGKEVWTYQWGGQGWRGIVLLVIIPIPFILPIGDGHTMTLIVEQGQIVSETERKTEFAWGALCGFTWHPHSSDDTGFHCGMWPWPGDS